MTYTSSKAVGSEEREEEEEKMVVVVDVVVVAVQKDEEEEKEEEIWEHSRMTHHSIDVINGSWLGAAHHPGGNIVWSAVVAVAVEPLASRLSGRPDLIVKIKDEEEGHLVKALKRLFLDNLAKIKEKR